MTYVADSVIPIIIRRNERIQIHGAATGIKKGDERFHAKSEGSISIVSARSRKNIPASSNIAEASRWLSPGRLSDLKAIDMINTIRNIPAVKSLAMNSVSPLNTG